MFANFKKYLKKKYSMDDPFTREIGNQENVHVKRTTKHLYSRNGKPGAGTRITRIRPGRTESAAEPTTHETCN